MHAHSNIYTWTLDVAGGQGCWDEQCGCNTWGWGRWWDSNTHTHSHTHTHTHMHTHTHTMTPTYALTYTRTVQKLFFSTKEIFIVSQIYSLHMIQPTESSQTIRLWQQCTMHTCIIYWCTFTELLSTPHPPSTPAHQKNHERILFFRDPVLASMLFKFLSFRDSGVKAF